MSAACLGAGPGNLVFVLDALKGAVAAGCALLAYTSYSMDFAGSGLADAIAASKVRLWTQLGVAGLIGALGRTQLFLLHEIPRRQGRCDFGRRAADPDARSQFVIAAVTWFTVFFSSRYVSLASISSAVALVVAAALC